MYHVEFLISTILSWILLPLGFTTIWSKTYLLKLKSTKFYGDLSHILGFPCSSVGKESAYNSGDWAQFLGWEGPWRRKWQPTPVFFPGESHGQRSLVGPVWGVESYRGDYPSAVRGAVKVIHNLATKPLAIYEPKWTFKELLEKSPEIQIKQWKIKHDIDGIIDTWWIEQNKEFRYWHTHI